MTKQTEEILARWHELDLGQRLSFLEELMQQDDLDEQTIMALHELFVQEAQQMGDTDILDNLLGEVLARMAQKKTQQTEQSDAYKQADENLKTQESQQSATEKPKPRRSRKKVKKDGVLVQETMLEFAENKKGELILREVGSDDPPLVRIEFSDKVKDMLADDVRLVGQAMIHAAIASVVQRQSNFWHANVYDEEPKHYS